MNHAGFLNKYLEETEQCSLEEVLNDEEFLDELNLKNENIIAL
jgi:hypothetical protein